MSSRDHIAYDRSLFRSGGIHTAAPEACAAASAVASRTRVLVLLAPDTRAPTLVRWAHTLAQAEHGTFACASLERPGATSAAAAVHMAAALTLAEALGGAVVHWPADDLFDALFRYVRQQHVTHIVIGRPHGVPVSRLIRETLPIELSDPACDVAVLVVSPATDGSR